MGSSIIVETTKPPSAGNTRRLLIQPLAIEAKGVQLMKSLPANGNRFFDMSRVTCNVTPKLQTGGVA